ncbi:MULTISPECIES: glycosyltransferase family A protein [Proteus]|uniref:glycosyltransferase family A protein n=1 Tax=Proteus TaxID=583 RepID=UPI001C5E02FD|nr:glycosyltransferase family A protein [Proteus terrae]
MKKYTIAVSTLNIGILQYPISTLEKMEKVELLIIHQISKEYMDMDFSPYYTKLQESGFSVRIIVSYALGLSKSRNIAIENCKTKYILFSDDDNYYVNNLIDILDKTTINEPLQIYSFKIIDHDGQPFKKYPNTEMLHNNRTILRLSSIENLYDNEFILKNNIRFNESFGLGAQYPSCEQPIFAKDILNNGGKGKFYPINVTVHPKENSGDDFFRTIQAKTRRKMFLKMYGFKGWLLITVFYLKKIKSVSIRNQFMFFYGTFIK